MDIIQAALMWTDQDRTRGSALYVSFSFEGAAAVQLGEDEGSGDGSDCFWTVLIY